MNITSTLAASLLTATGLALALKPERRSAIDVIDALDASTKDEKRRVGKKKKDGFLFLPEGPRYLALVPAKERARIRRWQIFLPFAISAGAVLLLGAFGVQKLLPLLFLSGSAFALGCLASKRYVLAKELAIKKQIEFQLPLVMERIVMAVQAGLDILGAITSLLELDAEQSEHKNLREAGDPITQLLAQCQALTEAGLPFRQALEETAGRYDSSPLRHAFLHLGHAHEEGGELIRPLRELSDSTQLFVQEVAEEDIAKLPFKATFPLLCTFIGLLICFLTSPLLEMSNLTSKVSLESNTEGR